MIISIDVEKSDKTQNSFMVKVLKKLAIEGNYLNIIKTVYDNDSQCTK
jgi:hypothetical protein